MNDKYKKYIIKIVNERDYEKGKRFSKKNILTDFYDRVTNKYTYLVRSEETSKTYLTRIFMNNLKMVDYAECTCPQYENTGSCKHIAACLIRDETELFKYSDISIEDYKLKRNKLFLEDAFSIYDNNAFNGLKKKVNMIVEYSFYKSYGRYVIEFKAKVGTDKFYSISSKINSFYRSVMTDEAYTLSKNFTYDPSTMFFDSKELSLLKLLYDARSYGTFKFNDDSLKNLFSNYDEYIYTNRGNKLEIIDSFPVRSKLVKENEKYKLEFSFDEPFFSITDDYEYVGVFDKVYHIKNRERKLLKLLIEDEFEDIEFREEDLPLFEKGILRGIKDNIEISDDINLVISNKPSVKFYFDLNDDDKEYDIVCTPKFCYGDEEISYFYPNIKTPNNVLRDADFENGCCLILSNYGFKKKKDAFYLDDIDEIASFKENGIIEISEEYPVFTSEKVNNLNIIKKPRVEAMFSIGRDEILSYNFKLDGVDNSDIDSLLDSLKKKKKYFRLKNGNLIDLEDSSLRELSDLSSDLDADSDNGVIPKYRALYLDSLKNSKYHIINTNGAFDKFIENFKQYKNANVTFNSSEKFLRDYQEDGVKWLYTIYKCSFGGILADEMGLGKSLQTLIFFRKVLEENKDARFLIVAPSSLIYNWENEVKKWTPEITYEVLSGNPSLRHKKIKSSKKKIFITSYATLREDIDFYDDISFTCAVIDEAQNIKNAKAGITKAVKRINASVKFALTGTPIENSIVELWSIFDFIMPGFLSSMKKFQEKYHFSDFDSNANDVISHLKRQVKPFILRRRKEDVTKELPPKITNNIYVDLSKKEKEVYAAVVAKTKKEMDDLIKDGGFNKSKMVILSLLTRLRQLCIDPHILFENYDGTSSKIDSLIDLIKELTLNGHKILLFTSFKTALDIVKKRLDRESISSYTIAGDVPSKKRQELVDSFNKDNTSVFLIMLKAGGTGLNLTAADVVIHLDPWWNPQAEEQATDRTHRIGQTKTVEVIKLICKGTIEEKIIELQEKKKKLSDAILEEGMNDSKIINNLTEKDIKDLISYTNKD